MQKTSNPAELAAIAKQVRRECIEMITAAKSGHPGGSLSVTDILVTLYFDVMSHDPSNPKWKDRDRFILSKGHCCPALYCGDGGMRVLSRKISSTRSASWVRFIRDTRMCDFFRRLKRRRDRWARASRWRWGWGWRRALDKSPSRAYVVIGDGESQEGQIWESAMFGGFHKNDNVCVIVDNNRIQLDGFVKDIMAI